jgi:transcriptional regulator with XRE-family HTH domain
MYYKVKIETMEEKKGDPTLAENVKRLRENKRLTQDKLAEKAGLSINMIQKIEAGERYGRKDTHQRLATALDVTIPELLTKPKSRIPDLPPDDPPLSQEKLDL